MKNDKILNRWIKLNQNIVTLNDKKNECNKIVGLMKDDKQKQLNEYMTIVDDIIERCVEIIEENVIKDMNSKEELTNSEREFFGNNFNEVNIETDTDDEGYIPHDYVPVKSERKKKEEKIVKISDKVIEDLTNKYKFPDGTIFTNKMLMDLEMWTDFVHDYGFDKYGAILMLRHQLGDATEYKQKYMSEYDRLTNEHENE